MTTENAMQRQHASQSSPTDRNLLFWAMLLAVTLSTLLFIRMLLMPTAVLHLDHVKAFRLNRWSGLLWRIEIECRQRPQHCRVNPFIHFYQPTGGWSEWSSFDQDQDGEPIYTSYVADNLHAYGSSNVYRRFHDENGTAFTPPNGAVEECEGIDWMQRPPDSVVCATMLMTEDGKDIERIIWVKCETWIHCGPYGKASGDCCRFMMQEPGTTCIDGTKIDAGIWTDKLFGECAMMATIRDQLDLSTY